MRLGANAETFTPECPTVGGLIDRYIEEVLGPCLDVPLGEEQDSSARISFHCAKSYKSVLNKWVRPRWEGHRVHDFDKLALRATVEQWLSSLWRSQRNPNGLAPKSVRSIYNVMKLTFKFAVKWGYIRENPMAEKRVELPRGSTKRVRQPIQLTVSQFFSLLSRLGVIAKLAVAFAGSDLAPNRYTIVADPIARLARPAQPAKTTEKNGLVYVPTYYPGTSERSRALSLDLHAGDEVPVNITLGVAQPFHVRGQVTNLPVNAREDAHIVLRPLDEDSTREVSPWPIDKDGKFDVTSVFPGSYSVLLISGSYQHPSVMRGDQTVQVIGADVEGLRISPVPNGQVRGRFHMDNGGKMDWSQTEVELYSSFSDKRWRGGAVDFSFQAVDWDDRPAHAELNKDGSFQIEDVPPDTYRLSMGSHGKVLDGCFVKAVKLGGEDVGDAGFGVAGASYSLDVVVGANGATVDGFVTDNEGKPASDVYVVIAPSGEGSPRRDLYDHTTTDYRGHFNLKGLRPGDFLLFAADEDAVQSDLNDPHFIHTHESLGRPVELKEGEHRSVTLTLAPSSN